MMAGIIVAGGVGSGQSLVGAELQLGLYEPHETSGPPFFERFAVEGLLLREWRVTTQLAWSTVHEQ